MSFLSLQPIGRPIAIVKGGNLDKKIVYLIDEFNPDHARAFKKFLKTKRTVHLSRDSQLAGLHEDIQHVYNDVRKEIELFDDGILEPIPNAELRECMYIAGPSGSGKSFFAANYLRNFKKLFPEYPRLLFSKKKRDAVLDDIGVSRVALDEELVEDPIDPMEEFGNTCCIFDDIDTVTPTAVKKAVQHLRDEILEVGRSERIYTVSTAHNLCNSKATKMLLLESTAVCMFPRSSDQYHMKYFLRMYAGCNKAAIDKIMRLPSRWVCVYRCMPNYVLHEKGVYLLRPPE